jgi:hypothetical protein
MTDQSCLAFTVARRAHYNYANIEVLIKYYGFIIEVVGTYVFY